MTYFPIISSILFEHSLRIILMIILLCCSAFFSGSETAFFQLTRRRIRQFSISKVPLERLVAKILEDPNLFLTALLFGNMLVNVLYFAGSSTLLMRISEQYGSVTGTVSALVFFSILLLFGEMLPKSAAYSNAQRFSVLASPVCYLVLNAFKPVVKTVDILFVRPAFRLFIKTRSVNAVSVHHLKVLLDSSQRQGLITNDENQLLAEILKFSFLKVRHVMLPRVEMKACSIQANGRDVIRQMLELRRNKLPVYTTGMDTIVGMVFLRDIFKDPSKKVVSVVRKVHFVPEQKTIESLIGFFKKSGSDHAVVVDEYGGVSGYVDLEDVMEQLLGPIEAAEGMKPIEQVGPLKYRISADLPIYDWVDAFGIDIAESRLTTIGGFVTALLGKIPEPGDRIRFKNMLFEIEQTNNNRIQSVILMLEPIVDGTKEP